jgi:hypothetical protein
MTCRPQMHSRRTAGGCARYMPPAPVAYVASGMASGCRAAATLFQIFIVVFHCNCSKEKVKFCIIEYIFIISDMKLSKVLALVVFGLLMVVQCAWALPAPTYATSALVRNAGRTSVPVVLTFGAEVSCLGSNSTVDVSSIGCSHNSMKMSATVPPKVSSTMGPVSIESGSTSQVWPIAYIVVGSTRVPIGELSRFFSGVVSPLGIGIGAPVSGQRVIKTVSGIYFSVPT